MMIEKMPPPAGRVTVVTGGSSGIGETLQGPGSVEHA